VDRPLLTILIPVYNGETYLKHLLGLFEAAYRKTPDIFKRVEIIVGNNVSTDCTRIVADSFISRLPMLRPISFAQHLPTAEENIFRSHSECRGVFVWALGVDEIPNFDCLGRVLAWLEKDEFDFYLFNYAIVSEKMSIRRTSNFSMQASSYPIGIVQLAQRFGFWFVLAGISGQIMRTDCVRGYDLKTLINETSPIYVHVAAYLEIFKDKRTVIINETIVFYQVTHCDVAHWKKTAKNIDVFDEYFWTLGYIRQLEYLEKKGIVEADFLSGMLETSEFNFFRPASVIADKLGSQLKLMAATKDKRNVLTSEQYQHIRDFLMLKEPFLRRYLWLADAIFEKLAKQRRISREEWQKLTSSLDDFRGNYVFSSLLVGTILGYDVFGLAGSYYAVSRQNQNALVERLRFVDTVDCGPEVFSGNSFEEVRNKVMSWKENRADVNAGLVHVLEQANRKLEATQNALLGMQHQYLSIRHSFFWKLTLPARWAVQVLKNLRSFPSF
jgi:glycosyltransferase involved in cell wall biosynthesis